jgi:pimeloyl-ACP methyl ester carboxylesterase
MNRADPLWGADQLCDGIAKALQSNLGHHGEEGGRVLVDDLVEAVEFPVDGMSLSGLRAVPAGGSSGVVLALHGGGSRAAYWHRDQAPDQSLLLLGAALGWTVLALDRPGYGASAGLPRQRQGLDRQADTVFALLHELECPVFIAAHSMGAVLALRMAADPRADKSLLGLAVAGVPLRYTEAKAAQLAAVPTGGEYVPPLRGGDPASYFGPPGSYDPALLTREGRIVAPVPIAEFTDVRETPATLPGVLERVRVPVQWTVAEFERSNEAGPEVLAEAGRLLSGAPRVEVHRQRDAGHNISLHNAARAYHLRVLAFAEECRSVVSSG